MDIRLSGPSDDLLLELRRVGRMDLGDFLSFVVEADRDHPTIEGDGMIHDGLRFRVQGQLAGKVYGGSFGLDVGFGDVLTEPPETPCLGCGRSPASLRIVAHLHALYIFHPTWLHLDGARDTSVQIRVPNLL